MYPVELPKTMPLMAIRDANLYADYLQSVVKKEIHSSLIKLNAQLLRLATLKPEELEKTDLQHIRTLRAETIRKLQSLFLLDLEDPGYEPKEENLVVRGLDLNFEGSELSIADRNVVANASVALTRLIGLIKSWKSRPKGSQNLVHERIAALRTAYFLAEAALQTLISRSLDNQQINKFDHKLNLNLRTTWLFASRDYLSIKPELDQFTR